MKRRIVVIFLTLFSVGVVYCQNAKQKPAVVPVPEPRIYFGKFIPDSVNSARVNEIFLADSMFLKGAAGRIISFDVYSIANKTAITESAFGNKLSKKQKHLIAGITPGQTVYIQKIMVKYPGREKTKSNSRFVFKIRN